MNRKSLIASSKGIEVARQVLIDRQLKQADILGHVCQSRSTISRFFNGKSVSNEIFVGICKYLGLDWREIAIVDSEKIEDHDYTDDRNDEVKSQNIRKKIRLEIEKRCGSMRVLDMRKPVGLTKIYTDVNILEKITGRRRLKINDLQQSFDPDLDDFNRYGLSNISADRVAGIDVVGKYPKLMVLGKPGAGKTTFLQIHSITMYLEESKCQEDSTIHHPEGVCRESGGVVPLRFYN